MDTINLALIGTRGGHYKGVLNEIEQMPDVRVVALAKGGDTVEPALKWCREHGHQPTLHEDHREMLNHVKPHAAIVCGPFERHAEMCADAIDRHIHVLTEKTAAITFEQLDHLRQSCAARPEVHLAGMMFSRYTPGFFTAHRLIRDGAIGDVRIVNARKSYKLGKRDDFYHKRESYGGTIPWIGSHAIDWIMWFTGGGFKRVFAAHSSAHNGGYGTMEVSATCEFVMSDGRLASASIDYLRPAAAPTHGDDWARIVGSEGVIEARPDSVKLTNRDNDGTKPFAVTSEKTLTRDFLDHIRGKSKSMLNAESTLALTEACLLARQSADENRTVEFASRK